jgi:ribonuclease I
MDYYKVTEELFQMIRRPSINIMSSATASVIKDAFLALNYPSLFASAIRVEMNSMNRLKEVKICYDLQFRFKSCA